MVYKSCVRWVCGELCVMDVQSCVRWVYADSCVKRWVYRELCKTVSAYRELCETGVPRGFGKMSIGSVA